jgi:Fe-S-cluster containining protein
MKVSEEVIKRVAEVYNWLDLQVATREDTDLKCKACGKCCDFESWGHRLYVSTPELAYFAAGRIAENIRPMRHGLCPYNLNGKCQAYDKRFIGCRVFLCEGDNDVEAELSNKSLEAMKRISNDCGMIWRYADLKTALNELIYQFL